MDFSFFFLVGHYTVKYILFSKSILTKEAEMKKNIFLSVCAFVLMLQGCVPAAWRTNSDIPLVAGHQISKDTVQGDTDVFYRDLWDAVYMNCRMKGVIKKESRERGYLQLDVLSTIIDIRTIRLTKKINRLRVTARKDRRPNLDAAKEMYNKILAEAQKLSDQ